MTLEGGGLVDLPRADKPLVFTEPASLSFQDLNVNRRGDSRAFHRTADIDLAASGKDGDQQQQVYRHGKGLADRVAREPSSESPKGLSRRCSPRP